MKKILALMLAAIMTTACFAGCGTSDTEIIGEVNVFNWGEYIDEDLLQQFTDETGIKVNYQTFDSNEIMYSKLKSGAASFDVIIPSDYMISRMIEEDMLEKLNFENIPNFDDIMETMKNPEYDPANEYSVPYTWGTVVLIYNTTLVDEADTTSWDILWNEKYKGQILMFDNSRDAMGIALKLLGYSMNTTDEAELQAAADLLSTQKDVLQGYAMDQILQKLPSGDAAIAPYYAGDYITMVEENPDLAYSIPAEGTNLFTDAMCIPKGAENKEYAEMFINFMTRTDVAAQNIEYIGYSTPVQSVYDDLDEETKNSVSYPSQDALANTEVFINLPSDTLELYDKLWIDIRK